VYVADDKNMKLSLHRTGLYSYSNNTVIICSRQNKNVLLQCLSPHRKTHLNSFCRYFRKQNITAFLFYLYNTIRIRVQTPYDVTETSDEADPCQVE